MWGLAAVVVAVHVGGLGEERVGVAAEEVGAAEGEGVVAVVGAEEVAVENTAQPHQLWVSSERNYRPYHLHAL